MNNQTIHKNRTDHRSAWRAMLLFSLLAFFHYGMLPASNILIINDAETETGKTFTVNVDIENSAAFVAFQFDIPLNDQFTYIENSAILNPDRKLDHSLSVTVSEANVMRVLVFSITNAAFSRNDGTVLSFQVKAGKSPGQYSLIPGNVIIGNASSVNISTGVQPGLVTIHQADTIEPNFNFDIFPNPSNGFIKINYEIPETSEVKITVNDISGRILATLENATFTAGSYSRDFDLNELNIRSSILLCHFQAKGNDDHYNKVLKLILTKNKER